MQIETKHNLRKRISNCCNKFNDAFVKKLLYFLVKLVTNHVKTHTDSRQQRVRQAEGKGDPQWQDRNGSY